MTIPRKGLREMGDETFMLSIVCLPLMLCLAMTRWWCGAVALSKSTFKIAVKYLQKLQGTAREVRCLRYSEI